MVGVGTRIGIDIEQYSVFLGGVGKESMTWILTLGLSAARLGTKKEKKAVHVNRLG